MNRYVRLDNFAVKSAERPLAAENASRFMKYLILSIFVLLLVDLVLGGLLQSLQPNHPADRPEQDKDHENR